MKTKLIILFIIILTSCDSRLNEKTNGDSLPDNSKIKNEVHKQDLADIRIDTLQINGQFYVQESKDEKFTCLVSLIGDTVINAEDYYSEAKILDINEDGYKDIRIFVVSNMLNQCVNYLYDKKLKTFRFVENCDLDIKKIKGTNFYYSYNRTGCTGMNWESYLSKIENFVLLEYGYLYGQGCEFEIEKKTQVIEIYKVNSSDKEKNELITRMPYIKHIPDYESRWSFIEDYWKGNFRIFER